jgi:hypothetical protein
MKPPYLTPAAQLVVPDATIADSLELNRELRRVFLERRGPTPPDPSLPAIQFQDAIELVNAWEKIIAPYAGVLVVHLPQLWHAWRTAYSNVFAAVSNAPNLRDRFPHPDTLWFRLFDPLAIHLDEFARSYHAGWPFAHTARA